MVRVQTCFCMDGFANLVSSLLQVVVRSSILQVCGMATTMLRIVCVMVYPNIVCCIHTLKQMMHFFIRVLCYIHRQCTTLFVATYVAL
jgi:hypothetical protein